MSNVTLRQGEIIAKLSEVCYRPEEGFEEDNTWQVAEAYISAASDTNIKHGPAIIEYDGKKFPITVRVLEIEAEPSEEDHDYDPGFSIDIAFAEGLAKLAQALHLL